MKQLSIEVSAIILTRNESDNILPCLESCSFAKEVILVDDESTDDTIKKAESHGNVRVFKRSLKGDFGAQQNFAIGQATCDWIFIIDADERVSPELADSIQEAVSSGQPAGYLLRRENYLGPGRKGHGHLKPDVVLRLMPRVGARVEGRVHQAYISAWPVRKLKGSLIHYPYRDWASCLKKYDNYSTLAAEQYAANGRRCSFFVDIVLRPLWSWFRVFFIQGGFIDGKDGWILSMYYYFYTMTKYAKLYDLVNKNKHCS